MYVDGYVLPVPKENLEGYRRIDRKAGKIWREHGALDCQECVGMDMPIKGMVPSPRGVKAKPGNTGVFAWVLFKSRAHRHRVNGKVMKDPRLFNMDHKPGPFDCTCMIYRGFQSHGRYLSAMRLARLPSGGQRAA